MQNQLPKLQTEPTKIPLFGTFVPPETKNKQSKHPPMKIDVILGLQWGDEGK
jgi:hypothetical protein